MLNWCFWPSGPKFESQWQIGSLTVVRTNIVIMQGNLQMHLVAKAEAKWSTFNTCSLIHSTFKTQYNVHQSDTKFSLNDHHTTTMKLPIFILYCIGPAVAAINGKITLVDVISFGFGCAKTPFPGFYTKVSKLKSWILKHSDAGSCQN